MIDKEMNKEQLKELARYGAASLLTIAFSISLCRIFLNFLDYRHSELVALIVSEIYAYFIHKLYVFQSHCRNRIALCSEVVRFFLARGVTEIFNKIGVMAVVEIVRLDRTRSESLIFIAVLLLNYLIRKNYVFIDDDA